MMNRRGFGGFRNADDAFGPLFWTAIFNIIVIIIIAIALYYFLQMVLSMIIPIAIAMAIVVAVTWIAKAYFTKKTGMLPPESKEGEGIL